MLGININNRISAVVGKRTEPVLICNEWQGMTTVLIIEEEYQL
jgi:hypothetical protein